MNASLTLKYFLLLLSIAGPNITKTLGAEVFFSPRGGCTTAVCHAIDSAVCSVDVATYQLSSAPIANSLIAAADRGVTVRIVIDGAQQVTPPPALSAVLRSHCRLYADGVEKIQHNKYAVIDSRLVITGSFNWSANAEEHNAENLLLLDDAALATSFSNDFQKHLSHSVLFVPKQPKRHAASDSPCFLRFSFVAPIEKEPITWLWLLPL